MGTRCQVSCITRTSWRYPLRGGSLMPARRFGDYHVAQFEGVRQLTWRGFIHIGLLLTILAFCPPLFLRMLTAEIVKVFGRLHDDPIHTRRRQAYEKRQWRKSREVGRLRCGGLYAGSIGMRTPMRSVERRVMASPLRNQRAPTTRACWHRS